MNILFNLDSILKSLIGFCIILLPLSAISQCIDGPVSPVDPNVTYTYVAYYPDGRDFCNVVDWYTIPAGVANLNNQNGTQIDVDWVTSGNHTLKVVISCPVDGQPAPDIFEATLLVTVNGPPSPPPVPSILNDCWNTASLKRATPPDGVTYYWQSGSNTYEETNSSESKIVNTDGNVYIRAKNSYGWSEPRYVTVDIKNYTQVEAGTDLFLCDSDVPINLGGLPTEGNWYLMGNPVEEISDGTLDPSLLSPEQYTVKYEKVYSANCKSEDYKYVDILVSPNKPSDPNLSAIGCGERTLTWATSTPPSNWYWQGNNANGRNENFSNNTYLVNSTGTYYLRAKGSNGCWSSESSSKYVVYYPEPEVPINTQEDVICYEGEVHLHAEPGINGNKVRWFNSEGSFILEANDLYRQVAQTTNYIAKTYNSNENCLSNGVLVQAEVLNLEIEAGSTSFSFDNKSPIELISNTPPDGYWLGNYVDNNYFDPSLSGEGSYQVTYNYDHSICGTIQDVRDIVVYKSPSISRNGYSLSVGVFSSYQWFKNDQPINGETNNVLTMSDYGSYKVKVSNSGSFTESNAIVIDNFVNYTRTYTANKSIKEINLIETSPINDVNVLTEYYDGYGRKIQVVQKEFSPSGFDFVQPLEYDNAGRQGINYLPYISYQNLGRYKLDAIGKGVLISKQDLSDHTNSYYSSPHFNFYNNFDNNNSDKVVNDPDPYSEKIFENSPLNRILMQGAPGIDYQPNTDHAIELAYRTNQSNEVVDWKFIYPDINNPYGLISFSSYYKYINDEGVLFVTETIDENDNLLIEYKDKQGKLILKKVQSYESISNKTTHYGFACTYYIYDDFGNLRFILPPELVENIIIDLVVTTEDLNKWAFQYKYDDRNRMIAKKVPGSDPVFMIYDQRDRLVLTQDGKMRDPALGGDPNKWLFTKYDHLNRPIATGTYINNSLNGTQLELQNWLKSEIGTSFTWFEGRDNNSFHGYTNSAFPVVDNSDEYFTFTFYDTYSYPHFKDFVAHNIINYLDDDGDDNGYFSRVNGQITGTKRRILGDTTWITSTTYYDDKYRIIETISDNQLPNGSGNGKDFIFVNYDFVGKIEKELFRQISDAGTYEITKDYVYDHAGRLIELYHQIGDDINDRVLMAKNIYNELGELVEKNIHQDSAHPNFLQSIDYRYNIRGWLKSINASNLLSDPAINDDISQPSDIFGMELKYDQLD